MLQSVSVYSFNMLSEHVEYAIGGSHACNLALIALRVLYIHQVSLFIIHIEKIETVFLMLEGEDHPMFGAKLKSGYIKCPYSTGVVTVMLLSSTF